MRRRLLLLPALLPALLAPLLALAPAASAATGTADVVQALRSDPVYVDPKAEVGVDAGKVRAAVRRGSLPIFVVVVPQKAADVNGGRTQLNARIGRQLPTPAVLFTVAGSSFTGGSSAGTGLGPGQADAIAQSAEGASSVTAGLVQAVSQVQAAVQQQGRTSRGSSSGAYGAGQQSGSAGGGGTVLAVLALIALGGGGLYWASARKRRQRRLEGSHADVTSLYDRLGADVANLSAGDDKVAQQALADAAERYNATGALLGRADTPGEFEAARRTVVEGLTAARVARQRLGLDPGPEVPPAPGTGPQLQQVQQVQVGDSAYDGSPFYTPGRRHYWGGGMLGGSMVPGGWYGVPFWESMVLGSALSGGLGGFGGGGYERGYEEGVEDARDTYRDDRDDRGDGGGSWGVGGDWGGGGGGDWGGAGDWGGGGGGDWGGGGGGSDGGGSW